ncbi:plastid lipid-associated protein 3, chloroplastic [Mercurialis annua]|uniref:plastid lipid-associated protein 3, chloroplastic n=1 Tax=Mercurialis annua TaxID=3986 RepID=UPI00216048F1|nr:plastid lipid-associated protein 3, chloroplastic [Mercurialis annua]
MKSGREIVIILEDRMASLLSLNSSSSIFSKNLNTQTSSKIPIPLRFFFNKPSLSLHFTSVGLLHPKSVFHCSSSSSSFESESESASESESKPNAYQTQDPNSSSSPVIVTDEWGEKTEPEPEYPSALDADPPKDDDEWEEEYASGGNGSTGGGSAAVGKDDRVEELKRCLVDTVYGTNFGFEASPEVRGEILELVNQLEALNPTPAPVDAFPKFDGNWVLLYTAFSELLPILALSSVPLLKVEKISQAVDTSNLTITNTASLSSPFATFSFSATAAFEVRSSSRIQVEFKEGTLHPPKINSRIDLPVNIDILGQNINLSPVQQSLNPLQDLVANISRTISGQPPFKVPIPGDRSKSWLLVTFLDEDVQISRGDGGLFVLVKEGSPLLDL